MPHGLLPTFAEQCTHWLGHQINHKAQHWVNHQVDEYRSEGLSSAHALMNDSSVIDIVDLNVTYDRKGGWSSSFSSWSTCEDNAIVVIRSTPSGIRISRVRSTVVPFVRELLRSGGKSASSSSWRYSSSSGPVGDQLEHHLTPYSQRPFSSFWKPASSPYSTATLLCGMSWLKWRFDGVFDRVPGKYPAAYRFSHWHGDGGVDHEAPWVGPRENAEYRDITVRYWTFKNATLNLACKSRRLPL